MRRFHVIAVTPDLTRTLVIKTSAGWLLPWLDDNPHAELPMQLEAILKPMTGSADMVHEAPLPTSCPDPVLAGYCTVIASQSLSKDAVFVPNVDLLATPALLPIQQRAWELAIRRLQAPVADFDSSARVRASLEWAEQQIALHSGARVLSMVRHRCSRYEYVVRFETTQGGMYFKGGLERVADEGVLTDLLQAQGIAVVPRTLAMDVAAGRWVYRELPGDLLQGPLLTEETAVAIISVLATLQQRIRVVPAVRHHLKARTLNALELCRAVDTVVRGDLNPDDGLRDHTDVSSLSCRWFACRDALFERCCAIDRLRLPLSIVLSDFWPRNILSTAGGVGFIDLERSYWSYPFLSLWRFAREVERILQTDVRVRMESAFMTAWADVVPPRDMARAVTEMPLLGRLFELLLASRELDLRARELGTRLSTKHRMAVISRHLGRLLEDTTG